jgi:phage gp36-like protein
MNAYVSARYALPLPTTPLVLKRCECELAYVQLLGSRVPDEWAKKSERWMAFLRDVSKGLVSLGPDASNNVPANAGAVFVDSEPAVFDRTTLADY